MNVLMIIRYGQYVKSGNNKWEKVRGKVESSVCEVIMLATISIVLLHVVRSCVRREQSG